MSKKKYKILIVDDVEDNLRIVGAILSMSGYQIKTARSGLSALQFVDEDEYDLILLDIMMPGMSGIETCRHLKVNPKSADIPVIFLTASTETNLLEKAYQVGGIDYIRKPFFKQELLARVESRLKLRDYKKNLEEKVKQRTKDMYDTQVEMMHILGGIAEGHSIETHSHVKRVSEFTYKLARLYGMDDEEASTLRDASYLHDVGKLGVPNTILHKSTALTKREFKEIQKHPALGGKMLSRSKLPLFKVAKIVAEEHHEKFDGTGYPKGLKADYIHIYGRIVAIADVFDALSFKRAYKKSWTQGDVLKYMREVRGKHFDPDLIDLLFENIDDFLEIYNTQIEKAELNKILQPKKRRSIIQWLLGRS